MKASISPSQTLAPTPPTRTAVSETTLRNVRCYSMTRDSTTLRSPSALPCPSQDVYHERLGGGHLSLRTLSATITGLPEVDTRNTAFSHRCPWTSFIQHTISREQLDLTQGFRIERGRITLFRVGSFADEL